MPNRDRGWPGKGEKVSFEQKGENGPRVHNETQGKLCKRRKTDKGKAQVRREESAFAQGVWPESRETGGDRGRLGKRSQGQAGAGTTWQSRFYSRSLEDLWTFQAGRCHELTSLFCLKSCWVLCGEWVGQE